VLALVVLLAAVSPAAAMSRALHEVWARLLP